MHKELTYGVDQIDMVIQELVPLVPDLDIITLRGSLGAGKTTLMHALMRAVGVQEPVTSPTFSYVNRYQTAQGRTVYHFDLYRIDSLDAFIAAGFDEYLNQTGALCCIEWPDVIVPLLQDKHVCKLTLEYEGLDKRKITIDREDA